MVARCWLGPFYVEKGPADRYSGQTWKVMRASGTAQLVAIKYRKDAVTACEALNRAGGIEPLPTLTGRIHRRRP